MQIKEGGLTDLPLADASCDATLCVLVLAYLDDADVDRTLAEMGAGAPPRRRAVVLDLLIHDREEFRRSTGQRSLGFDPGDLVARMKAVGFANANSQPLPPAPDATGPALLLATGTT